LDNISFVVQSLKFIGADMVFKPGKAESPSLVMDGISVGNDAENFEIKKIGSIDASLMYIDLNKAGGIKGQRTVCNGNDRTRRTGQKLKKGCSLESFDFNQSFHEYEIPYGNSYQTPVFLIGSVSALTVTVLILSFAIGIQIGNTSRWKDLSTAQRLPSLDSGIS
jgi:hypothetical protein